MQFIENKIYVMTSIYSKQLQCSLHNIVCKSPKHHVDDLLPDLLMECQLHAFGYDRRRDEYWGKKGGLHFTIGFSNKNKIAGTIICSTIELVFWGGNEKEANKIYGKLVEMAAIVDEFISCLQLCD
jgi:hypothetical protein